MWKTLWKSVDTLWIRGDILLIIPCLLCPFVALNKGIATINKVIHIYIPDIVLNIAIISSYQQIHTTNNNLYL